MKKTMLLQEPVKELKSCVIYVRVSSEDQTEGFSIPAQIELLVNYARKNNMKVARIFEEAMSAKDSGRIEFNRMLRYFKTHPDINTILVEKTDRLYRNFKDYALLDDNKFEIHLVKENEILSKDSTSHQKLVHGLKVLLAKNFIDNLREETYKGRKKKAEEGYIVGACPFGYKKRDKNTVEIEPIQGPFIKRCFELYAMGNSLSKVRTLMLDEGYVYGKREIAISRGHLYRVLSNITYSGRIEFEGKVYEGKFPYIVPPELFDKVQILLTKEREYVHDYLFINVIKCARCGCSVTAQVQKGRWIYYHCSGGARSCPQKTIYLTEQYVFNAFARAINKIKVTEQNIKWFQKCLKLDLKNIRFIDSEKKEDVMTNIELLKNQISTLYDDKLNNIVDEDFWKEKNKELKDKLAEMEEKLKVVSMVSEGSVSECMQYIEMIRVLPQMFLEGGYTIRKEIAQIIFDKVTLKGRVLQFKYALPFRYFVEE